MFKVSGPKYHLEYGFGNQKPQILDTWTLWVVLGDCFSDGSYTASVRFKELSYKSARYGVHVRRAWRSRKLAKEDYIAGSGCTASGSTLQEVDDEEACLDLVWHNVTGTLAYPKAYVQLLNK